MCLICVQYQQGQITANQGFKHLAEMKSKLGPIHAEFVHQKLSASRAQELEDQLVEGTYNPQDILVLEDMV
jgi:hypothetical protein